MASSLEEGGQPSTTEKTALLTKESSIILHGGFNKESVEVAKMKQVTHNDPQLTDSTEDYKNLLGSTRLLYNATVEQELTDLMRRSRRESGVVGGGASSSTSFQNNNQNGTAIASGNESVSASTHATKRLSLIYNKQRDHAILYLEKVKHSFFEDTKSLAAGTIPQSVVVATVIGVVCGIACWIYYTIMFFFLEYLWKTLPEKLVVDQWPEHLYWLWIPIVSFTMITCVGLTVVYMGEPGDLPYTIGRVHAQAYIPMDHVHPMVFASLFSILAGGSLGPEAPLVAICGALGGFVSRTIFRQKSTNIVRKHTLMGMAGALAAFFGVPLGGSLFALEVCSRFGVEYFEHMIESIFCGEICLVVFRSLASVPIAPIWDFTKLNGRMMEATPSQVLLGGAIGLYGALLAYLFALFHWKNIAMFGRLKLLDNSCAVYRGWLGAVGIIVTSILVPHTAFWGEEEIQIVANMGAAKDLPNIWPSTGLLGFEMDGPWQAAVVGTTKLIAISFTVAGGLRGGYIFPLMCAGSAFGRLLYFILPNTVPVQVAILCTAAGMNVAITRTALASTLILAFLPGEPCAIPAILMASLCSLFATSYMVSWTRSYPLRHDFEIALLDSQFLCFVLAAIHQEPDYT